MDTTGQKSAATPSPAATVAPAPAHKSRLWTAIGLHYHLAVILTLGTLVLFTYANSFTTGFPLDNKFIILEDPRLRDTKEENLKLIFQQDYWWPKAVSGLYRPLTTASYWLNYSVFGNADQPMGYHWVNFFLHWGNVCLAYFMVMVLMGNVWPAFFVAAIFGVHPIGTESVTNIIGRADLFATAAVLGGFLMYVKSATVTGWRRVGWLTGLSLITGVGVFCKESTVVVLGVIALYDFTFRIRPKHPNWLVNLFANGWEFLCKGYVALIPPFLAMYYVRSQLFEKMRPPELPWVDNNLAIPGTDFWTQRLTAIKVIGKYLYLLIWPNTLSPDYSYNQVPLVDWSFSSWEDWKAIVALVVVVLIILVAIKQYQRNKPVFFFIMFFFGTLLPTANLLKIIGSIMAERFLYLPSIGFAGCLVIAVYQLCRQVILRLPITDWALRLWLQLTARTVLIIIVACLGVRAFVRNFDWQDDITLWSKAVHAVPNSFKSHKSLAFALYEKDPEGKDIDRIIEEGEAALKVTDQTQIVLLHLGAYYRIKGDNLGQRSADGTILPTLQSLVWYQKSADVLAKAVPLDRAFNEDNRNKELKRGRKPEAIPDVGNHEIYWNLGLSLMRVSKYDEALEAYSYMRHLAPTNPDAYLSMASACLSAGRLEPAAILLLQTLLLDNSRQETLRLLVDLYRQFDREGCAVVFTQGQPRLNVDCQLVANHMCAAYLGLVQVFVNAKQMQLAQETKKNALQNYRCNPQSFDELLKPGPAQAVFPSVFR